jgi:hypothetical protein
MTIENTLHTCQTQVARPTQDHDKQANYLFFPVPSYPDIPKYGSLALGGVSLPTARDGTPNCQKHFHRAQMDLFLRFFFH